MNGVVFLKPAVDTQYKSNESAINAWCKGYSFWINNRITCNVFGVQRLQDSGQEPVIVIGEKQNIFIPTRWIK